MKIKNWLASLWHKVRSLFKKPKTEVVYQFTQTTIVPDLNTASDVPDEIRNKIAKAMFDQSMREFDFFYSSLDKFSSKTTKSSNKSIPSKMV